MPKTELQKLKKKLEKLERKYEDAPPIRKQRILKSAMATEKKINRLTGKE